MKREIVQAIDGIHLLAECDDTDTSRVYVTYPTDFTQTLCITVSGIRSIWVVKTVASVLYTQLVQQTDRSVDSIAGEIVAALFNLAISIGETPDVELVPAPYVNMADVSGIVVEELGDVHAPDGQYNPRALIYSSGEIVWSDYIGLLFAE